MKKLGMYTARGIVSQDETAAGSPQLIPLYDGTFKTAYRVIEFYIWPSNFSSDANPDVIGKLSRNDIGTTGSIDFFRADDDNQIAWAGAQGATNELNNVPTIIDPDNLCVEDLYVYARTGGTTSQPVNYMVVMEKYSISEEQGALLMARDRADGE